MLCRSNAMSLLKLLVCALLPAASMGVGVWLGACSSYPDTLMDTEEGMELMNKWTDMRLIYEHTGNSGADLLDCGKVSVADNVFTFEGKHEGADKIFDGKVVRHMDVTSGLFDWEHNYFTVEHDSESVNEKFPSYMFDANGNGYFDFEVTYATETEMMLYVCHGDWWMRRHSFYVFSNQDLSELDEDCMKDEIRAFANRGDFNLRRVNATACQ